MIRLTSLLLLGGLAACSTSDPLNTASRPDGTAGNPRGTEASRANDRAGDPLNLQGRPDGTAGNPSGTAVSRTLGTTDPEPAVRTRRVSNRRAMARRSARAGTRPSAMRSSAAGGPSRSGLRSGGSSVPLDPMAPNTQGQQPSNQQGGSGSGS